MHWIPPKMNRLSPQIFDKPTYQFKWRAKIIALHHCFHAGLDFAFILSVRVGLNFSSMIGPRRLAAHTKGNSGKRRQNLLPFNEKNPKLMKNTGARCGTKISIIEAKSRFLFCSVRFVRRWWDPSSIGFDPFIFFFHFHGAFQSPSFENPAGFNRDDYTRFREWCTRNWPYLLMDVSSFKSTGTSAGTRW